VLVVPPDDLLYGRLDGCSAPGSLSQAMNCLEQGAIGGHPIFFATPIAMGRLWDGFLHVNL
jgi:hypothetical protein